MHPRAADFGGQAPRAAPSLPPEAAVQTMPVESPDSVPAAAAPAGPARRIGLMLPLRSDALGGPADALRAGFMAAYERERAGLIVNLIETGDGAEEAREAYIRAARDNDIIVGPLARSAVGAVASSGAVSRPTIALNHPDGGSAVPPNMLVVGLSIEDEARQVAKWASAEHPRALALVVSGASSWQRRMASSFTAQWKQLGNPSQVVELPASNGYLSEAAINQLAQRLATEPPVLIFAALDADQLRQVRAILGSSLPTYGTSSVNPGVEAGAAMAELDGLRVLDMPWQVNPSHSAVMVYPRFISPTRKPDLERLYALGIDAFRIAREIALRPASSFSMDGVTGRMVVSFGQGPARFERIESGAVYQDGAFTLVDKRR